MSATVLARRIDLDWLRVIACYLLFPFHVGMVFNPAPFFHVRNAEVALPFLVLCGFISLWHMPLLFLLSGWSAHASLSRRGVRGFLGERGRKLAVPLVAGCVLLVPAIKYIELRGGQDLNRHGLRVAEALQPSFQSVIPEGLGVAPPFDETFLEFLPSFFADPDRFSWSHLWFVAYLLAFSLVLLPLLVALRRGAGAPGLRSPLWVYLPLFPLIAIQLLLRERFPGPYNLYSDWANVSYYATFLLAGFALARWPALEDVVTREWRRALAVAVVAALLLLAVVVGVVRSTPLVLIGASVAGWCFVVAGLGAAQRRLTEPGPRLAYLAESAFPIYVLHQPAVVLLGAWVVTLPLGVGAKFGLLLAGSIAATLAVYHYLVRRFWLPRLLLGMKPVAAEAAAHPAPRAVAALGRG